MQINFNLFQKTSRNNQQDNSMNRKRSKIRLISLLLTPFLLVALGYGSYLFWYSHRAQPSGESRELFQGIHYIREVTKIPVALVTHLVEIKLNTPGLSFLVTPGERGKKLPLKARTTSAFAEEFKTQLAINGDFFYPWHSNGVFNYYPHVGDPVTVEGYAASRGVPYSEEKDKGKFPTLYLSEQNEVSFMRPAKVYNAISGLWKILEKGKPTPFADPLRHPERDPRSAVGISQDRKTLYLLVIDGRQPHYSEGATVQEITQILTQHGASDAILLDGGGSSCLVSQEKSGDYKTLNSVIDKRIPGRQRPIANHLGVFVK